MNTLLRRALEARGLTVEKPGQCPQCKGDRALSVFDRGDHLVVECAFGCDPDAIGVELTLPPGVVVGEFAQKRPDAEPAEPTARAADGADRSDDRPRMSAADQLVELVEDAELFHSADRVAFATVPIGGHFETHEISGRAFKRWLAMRFWQERKRTAAPDAIRQAVTALEGRALFDSEQHEVHVRVALDREVLYLDLADADWRAVRVDAGGWRIVARPPVRFRRAAGMLPLPAPEPGGDLADLGAFVNVAEGAKGGDFVLLLGWLVASLRGRGPYPVLILQGEQGSAKSTTMRAARRLLDPNKAELRAQPREPRDIAIGANNARVLAFDNLSGVRDWLSDALCRLATGGGFSARALYTDSDEAIFDAQRPIMLNGIESVGSRGDLLDRAIILNLPRIERYRPEAELWADFEAARPKLLGALLDAVSMAMRHESEIQLERSVRMADAARWVVAAEPALPWEGARFLDAYATNRADSNLIALESSLVATAIMKMTFATWEGTAGTLLEELQKIVGEKTASSKTWPKSARGLSGELRRIAPNLRGVGFSVGLDDRRGHERARIITLTWPQGSGNNRPDRPHRPRGADAAARADDADGTDGVFPPFKEEFVF